MTGSLCCRVEHESRATPAAIYDLLMNVERWPQFLPNVSAASWERRGEPDTERGGIRLMRIGHSVIRDTVVDGTRPHHHAYVASFPWYTPLKDYRGDIRIEDRPSGSLIIWTVTFQPRIPGLPKNLMRARITASYTRLAAGLAREAERST
ncbi:SRPBCC family protein [Mycobacterium sp. E2479]|uniref:SRPBCC family protein n=1 Tax=Mycobacterium sp. E2479 TaxID=1834134 RepID=UPI0018D281BF|nr:SRPBCC family protein [Mycobacterium sp. E2479]